MGNTDSDHDKAESDETSKVEQLENRVEELESKLNNEMTRRALIAAGGVAGGGVLGTLFGSQRASAQTDPLVLRNVDQLGTSSNPVQDLYVENLTNYSSSETFDDLTVNNGVDAGSVTTDSATIGTLSHEVLEGNTRTNNRSFGTVYQNTTGTALLVRASAEATADATDIRIGLEFHDTSDIDNNPRKRLDQVRAWAFDTNQFTDEVVGLIPDGYHYSLRPFGDTADFQIFSWFEHEVRPR